MSQQPLPLEGINVIDFGTAIVGPLTGRIFADYGATVIKVESSLRPDVLRLSTPQRDGVSGIDRGGYFPPFNAGKMSLSLNMTKPKAQDIIKKLVPWADVLIETFTPRVMQGWGLGYQALSQLNPRLIMLSHCLQGQTGPRANMRGFGTQSAALTGLFEVTGWPGEDPVGPYAAYPDWIAYHFTVSALLAALDYRERTGKGQYIDQAQAESTMHFLAQSILDYSATGRIATRMGNRDPQMAPHGVFPCRGDDEWCAIAVEDEEAWKSFCSAMGRPELATDPRFASLAQRKANEDALEELVSDWTRPQDAKELMHALQAAGVAAGYVAKSKDLFEDPQLRHRGGFVEMDHPIIRKHRVHTFGFQLSETPVAPRTPAPCMGEHNDYVLKEIIGLSEADIETCRNENVLL